MFGVSLSFLEFQHFFRFYFACFSGCFSGKMWQTFVEFFNVSTWKDTRDNFHKKSIECRTETLGCLAVVLAVRAKPLSQDKKCRVGNKLVY